MPVKTSDPMRYLKPPRLPKASPVVILHVRADSDRNGNPRRAFVVLTTSGRHVETIDEGYGGETPMRARYPWFDHGTADALNLRNAYPVTIDAAPSEYKRWIRRGDDLDGETPELVQLRTLADRCEGYSLVLRALQGVRRAMAEHVYRRNYRELNDVPPTDDDGSTIIYHRRLSAHGDAASDYLRRAMLAFVAAGMVERTDNRGATAARASERAFFKHDVGHYRLTDTTPEV